MPNRDGDKTGDKTEQDDIVYDDDGTSRFLLRFHALFVVVTAVPLGPCLMQTHFPATTTTTTDACGGIGITAGYLVLLWHLGIGIASSHLCSYRRLRSYHRFLLPMSVWMLIPDLFLVGFARTLEFPKPSPSAWMIGGEDSVLPAMAGMWSIPGMMVLWASDPYHHHGAAAASASAASPGPLPWSAYGKAMAVAMAVLLPSEFSLSFLWHPTERVRHRLLGGGSHIALYVAVAELVLGPSILHFYHHAVRDSPNWYAPVVSGGTVMLLYTGALAVGLLAFETTTTTGPAMETAVSG